MMWPRGRRRAAVVIVSIALTVVVSILVAWILNRRSKR